MVHHIKVLHFHRIPTVLACLAGQHCSQGHAVPTAANNIVPTSLSVLLTEVQRRAAPVLLSGLDAVIQSETGSGKSLAFLVPLLARLRYPPDVFLQDLIGPQALVIVPSMELGVQVRHDSRLVARMSRRRGCSLHLQSTCMGR